MYKKEQIEIGGQPTGRLKASWLLFKESWKYLRADKEVVWIPFITGIINLVLFGVLVTVFVLLVMGGDFTLSEEGEPSSPIELVFIFACYIVGAFTLALSQAGIVNTVYTRAYGGDATLGQSLKVAFSRSGSLLMWSVITSTVGIVLRMIAERSKLLGRIVLFFFGVAWSLATYFVVPAMIIDKKSAFSSIGKSKQVFIDTWGETLVSNFSLGLTFLLVHLMSFLALIGLIITSIAFDLHQIFIPLIIVLYAVFFIVACLVQSALEGIVKTLLYIFASTGNAPANFNQELLEKMLARSNVPSLLLPTRRF